MTKTRLWLAAMLSLLERHVTLWRKAWSLRHALDGESFHRNETAFLASALALEKTPISPAPRITAWTIMILCLISLCWAYFGKVDIVATAAGKIVASGHAKTIQALETSSVQTILVHEGDSVKKGQLLIELDATIAAADTHRYEHDLIAAKLQTLRAKAILTALNTNLTPVIQRELIIPLEKLQEAQDQARGLFHEYQARMARIQSDLERHQAELNTTAEIIRKIQHTLPYAQKRAQDFKDLSDKNFVSQHAWMEKEQIRLEQEADLAMQRSRSLEIKAALKETQAQLKSLTAELRRQMLDAMSEGMQKFAILQQDIIKTTSRQHLMQLTSPIDGTVQQLAVNTIGGVVTPAQPLMLIVPNHHPIEIEALLENKDIGFVKKDQEAEIKIETFPYTRYGTIKGKVAHISQDAISDEKRGLTYLVHIQPERNKIQVDEKSVALSPGMVVSVEIKTGNRRVIEYFLNPLMQYANESLRER